MNKTTHGEASYSEWSIYHDNTPRALYSAEADVRLLCGSFNTGLRDKSGRDGFKDAEALEVGFRSGISLSLLGRLGMQLSDVEVAREIAEKGRSNLLGRGYKADLRVGCNLNPPFDDDKFDIVLSWEAMHHKNNGLEMKGLVAEHTHILKPGGRIIVGLTRHHHRMREYADSLQNGLYKIFNPMDHNFRKIVFYSNSKRQIKNYFSKIFKTALNQKTFEDFFTGTNDYSLLTAKKQII